MCDKRDTSDEDRPRGRRSEGTQPMDAVPQRAPAVAMLRIRADQLRREADALDKLAKFAGILDENSEAEMALWQLVVNQRS